jgi:hypothetical protein
MRTLTIDQFLTDQPPFGGALRNDGMVDVYDSADERPTVVTTLPRLIDAAEFRDRFTAAELAGVSALAYSGAGDVGAQLLLLRVATNRDGIDLDSADVIAGVDYLISKGKLAASRKAEILA